MIAELYEALLEINIQKSSAQKVAEAIEKFLVDKSENIRQNLIVEEFRPIEKENIGIRAELKFIGEKMEFGFAETDKRINMVIDQMKSGFAETDKRINMVIDQMKSGFAETDKRINMVIDQMKSGFAETDKRMSLGFAEMDKRMNLGFAEMDKRMKLGFEESDKKLNLTLAEISKRFQYLERLQIAMLSCLIGLLIKFLFFN
ncbi:MAG: hypothetical protein IT569_02560 [Leptospiraceae bacterium]|nr:hypothetical protein [Leptospiraceae bacterium]